MTAFHQQDVQCPAVFYTFIAACVTQPHVTGFMCSSGVHVDQDRPLLHRYIAQSVDLMSLLLYKHNLYTNKPLSC
jgi:hypothetical protein